ncbi:MAG: thiamine phosphate synthase [Gammaproteobacteria bacterium]|nr:thiamine phosphate synthase [Gammaproteobacteria bacterium]MCP5137160.1 thiamine phosphate synthase [Gammaproteobacteria bacterium]
MSPLKGLYAITRTHPDLRNQVEQALRGGARIIQYRDKSQDRQRRLAEAESLLELCRAHDALFLVNDDVTLATEVGADGVHIGRDDADFDQARNALGDAAIIGVSCYNRLELARAAQQQGADYVAFGSFFPSPTKPEAVPADFALLIMARAELDIPICAIGGIGVEHAPAIVSAGADMVAVISGVFGADDIEAAARAYAAIIRA